MLIPPSVLLKGYPEVHSCLPKIIPNNVMGQGAVTPVCHPGAKLIQCNHTYLTARPIDASISTFLGWKTLGIGTLFRSVRGCPQVIEGSLVQSLPHRYSVTATSTSDSYVDLASPGLPSIESAPPAEFDGPGDRWSPETLLVAAVADCFILTFKAIARASKMDWESLSCAVEGKLDRIDKTSRFTDFVLDVVLEVPADSDEEKAMLLLKKSEDACLITNSMYASTVLNAAVRKRETAPT